jgi:hypothetical protein
MKDPFGLKYSLIDQSMDWRFETEQLSVPGRVIFVLQQDQPEKSFAFLTNMNQVPAEALIQTFFNRWPAALAWDFAHQGVQDTAQACGSAEDPLRASDPSEGMLAELSSKTTVRLENLLECYAACLLRYLARRYFAFSTKAGQEEQDFLPQFLTCLENKGESEAFLAFDLNMSDEKNNHDLRKNIIININGNISCESSSRRLFICNSL